MSWPWKKKSSDKASAEIAAATSESLAAATSFTQDTYKKLDYVQISVESYSHLTGLEDRVKTYEEQIQTLDDQILELKEKHSSAQSELEIKEDMIKQHAKVAEEAVSGWEKAEAEALALKNHLETVTLAKLMSEDRAAHLDGALKECMRQIRNLQEEHEQKLQEVVLAKTKQCEKIKNGLEARIGEFEQELLRSTADNAALTRSLQERSNMLIKITEEKSRAEAEIEHLKGNIESCEREINSLKYELHIVSKEFEIRNEEKNMSIKSAEVANKQHMEGARKIAKLEAECQRLRGLVRKKLPGPAALAQMKMEVETLERGPGESRLRKSPVKPSNPHLSAVTEFSFDNAQKFQKENEFLTERLLATEEETKMLKEALAKRNSELQASRSMCAKTLTKLQSLEAQLQSSNHLKGSPTSIIQTTQEGLYSQNASNTPSLTSLSEDGNDDDRSYTDSWPTVLISEQSQFRKENDIGKSRKTGSTSNLALMDDFLEMEKLACLGNSNEGITVSVSSSDDQITGVESKEIKGGVAAAKDFVTGKKCESDLVPNQASSAVELSFAHPGPDVGLVPLEEIHSRISAIVESLVKDGDMEEKLEEIRCVLEGAYKTLSRQCTNCIPQDKTIDLLHLESEPRHVLTPDIEPAISPIHDFVLYLGKQLLAIHGISPDDDVMSRKIDDFSGTYNQVMRKNASLEQFICDLSCVLAEAGNFRFNVLSYKGIEAESNSLDCIDKVALPENKLVQEESSKGERYQNGCTHIPNPSSNPEVPDDGTMVTSFESNKICNAFLQEFEELKLEKVKKETELAKCSENLETTKYQLQQTEQLLAEVKSQLASAQRSNSLAETQLKCMAESYRTLETRSKELETEHNRLIVKTETLENELQDEKTAHEDVLASCKELEEQLHRHERAEAEDDIKSKQERELASAAAKLAECQETIFLLGKQLKALHPQTEVMSSPTSERTQRDRGFIEEEPTVSGMNFKDQMELPVKLYNTPCSPSDREKANLSPVRRPKHRPTKSTSSSASSTPTPEKHSRGFSRFFSNKSKNDY